MTTDRKHYTDEDLARMEAFATDAARHGGLYPIRAEDVLALVAAVREAWAALEELRACNEDCYKGMVQMGVETEGSRNIFANIEDCDRFIAAYRHAVCIVKEAGHD